MAGEMSVADLQDYPLHADVAHLVGGTVHPFDVYIGPYIQVPEGRIFLDTSEESVTLWPRGLAPAYCAPVTAAVFGDTADDYADAVRVVQGGER